MGTIAPIRPITGTAVLRVSAVGVGLPGREVVRSALIEEQRDECAQGLPKGYEHTVGPLPYADAVEGEFVAQVRVLVRREPVSAGRVLDHLGGFGRVVVRAAEIDRAGVQISREPGGRGGCLDLLPALTREGEQAPERGQLGVDPATVVQGRVGLFGIREGVDAALDEESRGVFDARHVPQDAFLAVPRDCWIGSPVTGSVQMP